ncbi:MAG: hypothetical protein GTO18_22060 [Anaerolineales bacterium]|nr:hypothetical protein [Anaerolineales bacterium]
MSSGELTTETRDVKGFTQVELKDYGDMVIEQGIEEALTVEAHPDILKKIKTEVRDGCLIIEVKGTWLDKVGDVLSTGFTGRKIHYSLTVKDLNRLSISGAARVRASDIESDELALRVSGAADVRIDTLAARSLEVSLPGTGRIQLNGETDDQHIRVSGAGHYDGGRLECNTAAIKLSGAGSATLWVTEGLDVTISGIGNVSYYGSPKLQRNITGLGSITPLGEP